MDGIRYISWAEFDFMLEDITDQIQARTLYSERASDAVREEEPQYRTPRAIYGHQRGGLVLATCLAHRLKLRMWTTPAAGSIWVDDIFDSGKTYTENKRESLYPVCLLVRESCVTFPGTAIFGGEARNGDWIVFPWEDKCLEHIKREMAERTVKLGGGEGAVQD